MLSLCLPLIATPVLAQTRAGTAITNIATLQATIGTDPRTIVSNDVRLVTAELLDVALTRDSSTPVTVVSGGTALPVTVTNRGNGDEAFAVTAVVGNGSIAVRVIAIDVDGDGRFDPTRDTVLADGRTPILAPGAAVALLVVVDPAATPVTATTVTITARATTGSGNPGTLFAGQGDGGGDAVTGSTGAVAQLSVPVTPGDASLPTLAKRQSVVASDGSARAVRGATITYVLEARFPAATSAARLNDPIPAGTAYVPGSLRLDTLALTDTTDADAGSADAGGIAVVLGDVAAASVRTVQFQVTIQ